MNQLKNKLPKGKYNGQTIDGIEIKFQITLLNWRSLYINRKDGNLTIIFAWFKLWIDPHYVVDMDVSTENPEPPK